MNTMKLLPATALALVIAGTGALVATAQTGPGAMSAPQAQNPAQNQAQRAELRGDRDGDRTGERHSHRAGHHGGRGGERGEGRGAGGFGMRGGGDMMRTIFIAIDADGNGAVTQEEIDTYRAARVTEADTSGDGALSIEEFDTLYRAFTRSRMVDMFQDLDADGDGVISAEEMDVRFGNVVDRMDRNDDGALTLQERGRRG